MLTKLTASPSETTQEGTEENKTSKITQLPIDPERLSAVEPSWEELLEYDSSSGRPVSSRENVRLILVNDPKLGFKCGFNELTNQIESIGLPKWRNAFETNTSWSNVDNAGLRHFLELEYKIKGVKAIEDALELAARVNWFHPIRDYLTNLEWDGISRADSLLIEYLGADDSAYVREVTRKTLVAAVARIFQPGVKFDYVLTLSGSQGGGKSSIFKVLTKNMSWYSDSVQGMKGREPMEQMQGKWIIELGEMSATNATKMEFVKQFITSQSDDYRAAYSRKSANHLRQCILIATTNKKKFLKDPTGDRRFWPVYVGVNGHSKSWPDLDPSTRDQIWAEAMILWQNGEKLFLDPEMESEADRRRQSASTVPNYSKLVEEFLNIQIPKNWRNMARQEQHSFYLQPANWSQEDLVDRLFVCGAEIREACFGIVNSDVSALTNDEINLVMDEMPGWKKMSRKARISGYASRFGYSRLAGSGQHPVS